MPTSSPAPEDEPASESRNRVFVTGAGFTRALVPNAPLLIDDFGGTGRLDSEDVIVQLVHTSRNLSADCEVEVFLAHVDRRVPASPNIDFTQPTHTIFQP